MARYQIDDFLGEGWFPIETDGIKQWVWSKKEASLNFPHGHSGFSLGISGCPAGSTDLIIYCEDNKMGSCKLTDSLVPINIPSGVTSLKIELTNSCAPKQILGTPDIRPLGVCLHSISSPELYKETCKWFPKLIEMSLTAVCNINPPCVMCVTRNFQNRVPPYLSDNIIDKMRPYLSHAKMVALHGGEGEPLLSPKLLDVLNSIDKNVYTMFATNGLLLTKEMSYRLILAGLKEINFSIDAAKPTTYNKIRNNNGFYPISNNIRQLVNLKKVYGVSYPNIIINMVLMKENMPELPDFIDLAYELEIPTVQVRFLRPLSKNYKINTGNFYFDYYEQRIDPDSDELRQIIDITKKKAIQNSINFVCDNPELIALLNRDSLPPKTIHETNQVTLTLCGDILTQEPLAIQQELLCRDPWQHIFIDLNGSVSFCCHSRQALGNLNNKNFEEIWNDEIAQSIRNSFLKNELPKGCLSCPLRLSQNQIWNH